MLKKHIRKLVVILTFSLAFTVSATAQSLIPRAVDKLNLSAPANIQIEIFASNVPHARHMAFDDQGILFVSQTYDGKVVALPDLGNKGKADNVTAILENEKRPHGLAFARLDTGYYLYVAEERRVIRMKRLAKPLAYGEPEVIVPDIPVGEGHFTRTIKIKDNKLYLSVGSSCNVCIEKDKMRAAISRYDLDGKNSELFATGLRNTVGMEFSPYTGELWGVDNGRDMLGDELPREKLNIIRRGKNYGWPYCIEDKKWDKDFNIPYDCGGTEPPAQMFPAHHAPLGMAFYQTGALPREFNNSLFITFHGSWNRTVPAGYKVVRVKLSEQGEIISHEDFITGWLRPNGKPDGRPVDLEQSPAGDLYLSDDYLGVVYRISSAH